MKQVIIFGGTGFIGLHFTRHLLDNAGVDRVILADIKPPQAHLASRFVADALADGRVRYVVCDVRRPIELAVEGPVDLIANFAAVHREPGHAHHEYFETNLPGARHVCAWAEQVGCNTLIFTSSISPYGPSETPKDESSIPTPETAYGSSKLAAELIHEAWRAGDPTHRRLLIMRPGVVFGPGEGGNVSRLVKALSKGFFVYAGNKTTRKAGIYVKELCNAMTWLLQHMADHGKTLLVANGSFNPGPSMEEYVETVRQVTGRAALVPNIPKWVLMTMAYLIHNTAGRLGLLKGVNPVRVRKIIRSNDIRPKVLVTLGYTYAYSLREALTDWKRSAPEEWLA